jgi:hypothetical protein
MPCFDENARPEAVYQVLGGFGCVRWVMRMQNMSHTTGAAYPPIMSLRK